MASSALRLFPSPPTAVALIRRSHSCACSTSAPPSPEPKVVVTREPSKNGPLVAALAKHDVHCLELPLIRHVDGPDTSKLPLILQNNKFDWIVITSPEAGAVFLQAWRLAGCPKVRIGVVGAGTANIFHEAEIGNHTLEVAFSPSQAMGKVLASELPMSSQSCRVLYPASVKASNDIEDGLLGRGFNVTRLNTYNTLPVEDVDPLVLKSALVAPVVAVASPSAVRAWVKIASEHGDWDNAVACIGKTTAVAARKLGLKKVHYPADPGLQGWVDSVLEALAAQQGLHKAFSG